MQITDSTLRLYDSIESFQNNPTDYVLLLHLSRNHELSKITTKNYGTTPDGNPFDVHTFYIEETNGIWMNTRVLKVGSPDINVVENLYSGIKRAMV